MVQIQSKGRTKNTQEDIEQAVRRYLDKGESVGVLAKYYKVSQPAVYKWISAYKEAQVAKAKTAGMDGASIERATSRDAAFVIEELKKENRKLRDRLLDLMIKTGDL